MSQAAATETTTTLDGRPRRINWTCRFCFHPFKTWTRRGLNITCPSCHRVQEGPAGIQRLVDAQKKKQRPAAVEATPVRVVVVNGADKPAPVKKPGTRTVAKAAAASARAAVVPAAAKPSSTPPPPPAKDPISRLLGF